MLIEFDISAEVTVWPGSRLGLEDDLEAALEVEALLERAVDRRAGPAEQRDAGERRDAAMSDQGQMGAARGQARNRLARPGRSRRQSARGARPRLPSRPPPHPRRRPAPRPATAATARRSSVTTTPGAISIRSSLSPASRTIACMPPAVMISSPDDDAVLHRRVCALAAPRREPRAGPRPAGEDDDDDDYRSHVAPSRSRQSRL